MSEAKHPAIYQTLLTLSNVRQSIRTAKKCDRMIEYLESKDHILFLTTSTRYVEHSFDIPKTTQLAMKIQKYLRLRKKHVSLIDVPTLNIHACEGNISALKGNNCGVAEARLPNRRMNPTGMHRCWASINNPDDQLYKITREFFKSQCVVFFVSVRWGQANSVYQRLFERLSWIENRISTLGEGPIPQLKKLEAGIVLFGQNWKGDSVLETQKENFKWFKWKTPSALSFNWQFTNAPEDESPTSYKQAAEVFPQIMNIALPPAKFLAR